MGRSINAKLIGKIPLEVLLKYFYRKFPEGEVFEGIEDLNHFFENRHGWINIKVNGIWQSIFISYLDTRYENHEFYFNKADWSPKELEQNKLRLSQEGTFLSMRWSEDAPQILKEAVEEFGGWYTEDDTNILPIRVYGRLEGNKRLDNIRMSYTYQLLGTIKVETLKKSGMKITEKRHIDLSCPYVYSTDVFLTEENTMRYDTDYDWFLNLLVLDGYITQEFADLKPLIRNQS